MTGSVRARVSQPLSSSLGWLASLSPRAAFVLTGALAALASITSRRYTRRMLHALFPELPPRAAGATLRRIWSTHLRTLLLRDWMRRNGMEPIRPLVRECEALGHLRAPMLLSTFHIGPTLALGVLSERLQGETLVLRGAKFPLHRTTRLNIDFVEGSEQQRAATFHRAIEYLRGGGFVVVALDPAEAGRLDAPFLGGTLQLARGPFAMARVAGVPIVPIVSRWDGNEIELVVGDPIAAVDDESALAAAAARWLERYLRESPGELSARVLDLMTPR